MLAVPAQVRAFQRIALEDRDQNKHNKVGDVEPYGNIACNSEPLLRKDTQVEAEDGNLGYWKNTQIETLVNQVKLNARVSICLDKKK